MVGYEQVKASNGLLGDATAPKVSVFVGGSSGIGMYTIRELVKTGASVRIYIVGRKSAAERTQTFIEELKTINTKAEVIWLEGEVSLLAETKRICEVIQMRERRIDLIFLTTGYAPFGQRKETAEGFEVVQVLEYYARILFILKLLPQLRLAEAPRVVSVLAGGMESKGTINVDDLDLQKLGSFSGFHAQRQYASMTTVAMDQLAADHADVTFVHSWPLIVNTGNARRSAEPGTLMAWVFWLLELVAGFFIALTAEESGQRHLFQSTSALYGGRGITWTGPPGVNAREQQANGLFLVNYKCDCTPNATVVSVLRETTQEKVWEHTQQVLGPCL